MRVAIASDHGGVEAKKVVVALLRERGAEVNDLGCHDSTSVDYPDYARDTVMAMARGEADEGILICKSGIGMSIAANKYHGIRAALCLTPEMAHLARTHNNANVLVLGGQNMSASGTKDVVNAWLDNSFVSDARHVRRLKKVADYAADEADISALCATDPVICDAVRGEVRHERATINLIASENYASRAVRQAQGSVMTNKYAEGYAGKRYYNGCDYVDVAERNAVERANAIFGSEHANVQPHCGSSANMAVYFAALNPGDTILAMSLAHGGHLTHGHKVNFSGRLFNVINYGVSEATGTIDHDEVARLAKEHKPKLLVVGASAYPRTLEFERFRAIADDVGALMMVDMAHIAGLVAGGAHPSPVPWAEFVTSTTHKTLRGPRSGMVLCRKAYAEALDKQVFPGLQGGPLMHVIAAKAVCFHEASAPSFKGYAEQVVRNAKVLAEVLMKNGFQLVSGGTDNHLMLVSLVSRGLTGRDAAAALDKAGLIVNKNSIPFDPKPPMITSGIRIGTPAATTRGMKEAEMVAIGAWIAEVLRHPGDAAVLKKVRAEVETLALSLPPP